MKKISELMPEAYDFNGKLPLKQAIPLGLQHVMAMFVGNLTPLLIITGACGIGAADRRRRGLRRCRGPFPAGIPARDAGDRTEVMAQNLLM